jgi:excisionase family DNA binding protein
MKPIVEKRVRLATVLGGPPDPRVEMTLSPQRAAQILGVSTRAVHKAMDRGDCPVVRVGRLRRVPTAQFLAAYGLPDPSRDEPAPESPHLSQERRS